MDSDIKQAWRDKLAHNQQGKGYLRIAAGTADDDNTVTDYDRFCCWGLYCEVLVERGIAERRELTSVHSGVQTSYRLKGTKDEDRFGGGWRWGYPPQELVEAGGIADYVNGSDSVVHLLAGMNDNGSNFAAISSVIEELL